MSKNYNSHIQTNNTDLQAILNKINELPEAGGVELPELSNEGVALDLLSGKELINQEGEVIVGAMKNNGVISSTMNGIDVKSISIPAGYTDGGTISLDNTIDTEVNEQANLITQIKNVVDNLPEAEKEINISTSTITIVSYYDIHGYTATTFVDGQIMAIESPLIYEKSITIPNVIKGSILSFHTNSHIVPNYSVSDSGVTAVQNDIHRPGLGFWAFVISPSAADEVTIQAWEDD